MKHALMVYDYGYYWGRVKKVNIGDYIQSLAAKQFLPSVDVYIDRDSINSYSGERVKMLMNGWWWIFSGNNDISKSIIPFFISYHLNNPQSLDSSVLRYLEKYQPIGCRDWQTVETLRAYGIASYFSGCLTLTLGQQYSVDESSKRSGIVFCDYPFIERLTRKIRNFRRDVILKREISKILGGYTNEPVEYTNHLYELGKSYEAYFEIAMQLLRRYASAKLVVTSRLHCALPCVGMGTPVLFVYHSYDEQRYRGLIDLANTLGFDEKGSLCSNVTLEDGTKAVLLPGGKTKNIINNMTQKVESFIADEING